MESWAVPMAALVVSLATLIFGAISLRSKAEGKVTDGIAARLDDAMRQIQGLETAVRECHQERAALQRENIELLRQLAGR